MSCYGALPELRIFRILPASIAFVYILYFICDYFKSFFADYLQTVIKICSFEQKNSADTQFLLISAS
jgi:hypothetical protein